MTEVALGAVGLDAEQFTHLVDHLPLIVWSTDTGCRLVSVHGGGLRAFGVVPGPADRRPITAGYDDPREAAAVLAAHRAALRGESVSYETTYRGRVFSAQVEALRGGNGVPAGVVGFAIDITAQRRVETALRDSETRLRAIIEAEPECVKLIDRNGCLIEMNPAGLAMLEADSLEQLRGRPIAEVVAPAHRAAFGGLHRRVFTGEPGTLEFEVVGLKGTRRWLSTHAVPLRDAAGTIYAVLTITRDATAAKRADEQLRASRAALRRLATRQQDIREDERTRIAREIHDSLGQALTALKLELSAAQVAATAGRRGIANRLAETARLVDELIKGVRRIATELRPPVLDELGLPAAVEWLARDFMRRTGIACHVQIHSGDALGRRELATVLFRITQEALTNVSRHAAASHVAIDLGVRSDVVVLEITDDGRGITEPDATGPQSLGILGMRERAAAVGGVLEVGPGTGGGTRVAAWFPAPPALPAPPAHPDRTHR
ncbi:MAG: PAS domain-containing sensor histidine kinase [Gemmatimonadales bacterium]